MGKWTYIMLKSSCSCDGLITKSLNSHTYKSPHNCPLYCKCAISILGYPTQDVMVSIIAFENHDSKSRSLDLNNILEKSILISYSVWRWCTDRLCRTYMIPSNTNSHRTCPIAISSPVWSQINCASDGVACCTLVGGNGQITCSAFQGQQWGTARHADIQFKVRSAGSRLAQVTICFL